MADINSMVYPQNSLQSFDKWSQSQRKYWLCLACQMFTFHYVNKQVVYMSTHPCMTINIVQT